MHHVADHTSIAISRTMIAASAAATEIGVGVRIRVGVLLTPPPLSVVLRWRMRGWQAARSDALPKGRSARASGGRGGAGGLRTQVGLALFGQGSRDERMLQHAPPFPVECDALSSKHAAHPLTGWENQKATRGGKRIEVLMRLHGGESRPRRSKRHGCWP